MSGGGSLTVTSSCFVGGNLLVSVHAENSEAAKRAEQIFKTAKAEDICSTTEASVPKAKDSHPRA